MPKDSQDHVYIYDGKYTAVMNRNGTIREFLRYGDRWPVADDLVHSGLVLALVADLIEARHSEQESKTDDQQA